MNRTPTPEEMEEIAGYFLSAGFRINFPDGKMLATIATPAQVKKALTQVTAVEKAAGKTPLVNTVARLVQEPTQGDPECQKV